MSADTGSNYHLRGVVHSILPNELADISYEKKKNNTMFAHSSLQWLCNTKINAIIAISKLIIDTIIRY